MIDKLFKKYVDNYNENVSESNDRTLASYLKTRNLIIKLPDLIEGLDSIDKIHKHTAKEAYSILLSRYNLSNFESCLVSKEWLKLMFLLCAYNFEKDDSRLEQIKIYQKSLYLFDFLKLDAEEHIINTVYPELFSEYKHYLLFGQVPWHIFYAKIEDMDISLERIKLC